MSRSELHNWECAIEELSGDNADKMLVIAQDIYNTAFVRGKNYMSLEQQPTTKDVLNQLKDEIYDKGFNSPLMNPIFTCTEIIEMIDKYITDIELQESE